ncbi:reverse transcriptase domain-containing protein [Tanacetum coccineum]
MDDKPMWTADHVVALTPGSAITISETANEFSIKEIDSCGVMGEVLEANWTINRSLKQSALEEVTWVNIVLMEWLTISDLALPPKLGDPGSFLIPCNFNKAFSCNGLADLGASINLMLYSLYAKLSLETLKPTKMSVRLADQSFKYPVGIAENMFAEVGKFTILLDFVILKMEKDIKVLLILGRPFLYTADAVIRVKHKQLNLRVGTERMIFHIDSAMKHSHSNDDTCFSIDVIDEILEEYFNALLDERKPPFEKLTFNTDYKIKTSLEEPPTDLELKPLPDNLEYAFLEEPSFLLVIISSQLSEENKNKRMPFGSCNAPAIFQRCMLAIFHDMNEESIKVFMDDFSVFGNSSDNCLNNLNKVLQHCKDAHLVLNGEKCHFMVKEGIMLGHKVSKAGLKVDKAKIDVISKLPSSTNIKEKLTCALVVVSPNWNLPFELMCDASDFTIRAILGQKDGKNFQPIYFASKTLNAAQRNYTYEKRTYGCSLCI